MAIPTNTYTPTVSFDLRWNPEKKVWVLHYWIPAPRGKGSIDGWQEVDTTAPIDHQAAVKLRRALELELRQLRLF